MSYFLKEVLGPCFTSTEESFSTRLPSAWSGFRQEVFPSLVREIRERDAASITVGDRCGPGNTKQVMEKKGIFDLGRDMGFEVLNFEDLKDRDWGLINPGGNHWEGGFYMARPLVE
ncbi:MAG: hypothetical protein JRJ85_25910, partial [Deltaproteobacteria bacterium]|nr:hypothetical protein [Deltaproteobacteria bacterium]